MNNSWQSLRSAIQSRREMAVHLIQELVRRPSIGDETEVQTFIAEWWLERNIHPDLWEPDIKDLKRLKGFVEVDYDYSGRFNQVVMIKGKGGGHSLTLNGHTDVVPVEPAPWTHGDPWGGQYVNGRVYGRGSVDMKGGLAVGMIAMDALLECGISLKGDLQMQFVVDEENGGNGTLAAIQRGYRSDGTIFLEPIDAGVMFVSSRGARFFRIVLPGVEAGIEYLFTTPQVIEKAFYILKRIQDYAEWRNSQANHPLYEWDSTKIPATVCKIHAGSWPSTLPSRCVMEGSIECLPGEDIDKITAAFKEYIMLAARQDPWLADHPPEVEFFGLRYESGETQIDHPFVATLQKTYERVTGKKLKVRGGGGTDLRLPLLYANSASVIIGPTGGSFHATDEYVDIDSVMQTALVLGKFILDWCEEI